MQVSVVFSCLKKHVFIISLQLSRWNLDVLCSLPYTLHFLMDLIWTKIWQNEDPKLARQQLFSQISGEHWLGLVLPEANLHHHTQHAPPGDGIHLCPPLLSSLLDHVLLCHRSASEQHSPSHLPAPSLMGFRLRFFQIIQFGAIKKTPHTKRNEKAGVFKHRFPQAWRSSMAGER